MYQLWVTVTLTSELVFRIIMSGAYLLYYLRYESKIGVWVHIWMVECRVLFMGYCDLDLDFRPCL